MKTTTSHTPGPKLIPSSRRFWKDQWHPYGWEVGFSQTVIFPDGTKQRERFRDIGTTKRTAMANALRRLDVIYKKGVQ
jgi:hypothetical protein